MQRNIGWITNPLILVIGLIFFWQSTYISVGSADAIGPRLVPMLMSAAVVVFSLPLIYWDLHPHKAEAWEFDDITVETLLLMAGPLLVMVAVYGQMMSWFGYLVSTIACAFVVFLIFGNSLRTSAIHAVVGGVLFYIIFIRLMGIFDPHGSIIDVSDFL